MSNALKKPRCNERDDGPLNEQAGAQLSMLPVWSFNLQEDALSWVLSLGPQTNGEVRLRFHTSDYATNICTNIHTCKRFTLALKSLFPKSPATKNKLVTKWDCFSLPQQK